MSTGRFTVYLCGMIHDMHMTCVDRWAPAEPSDREFSETYSNWNHEANYQKFKDFSVEQFPGRVKIMRTSTDEAVKMVADASLDFVFIDADHTYEGCLADIRNWTPKVRSGGLICGHDLNWPSVYKAVRETGPASLAADNVWLRYAE